MTERFATALAASPDPATAALRLEQLQEDATARSHIEALPDARVHDFVHLIAWSDFLFRQLCRHPDAIALLLDGEGDTLAPPDNPDDADAVRQWKYRELLRISWRDIMQELPYEKILYQLSHLADSVIQSVLAIVASNSHQNAPVAIMALGKLGAEELNFSSDVDLIFVAADAHDVEGDIHDYQAAVINRIRQFNRIMEQVTVDGFLYRVDLKLRPWGRSGPLVLPAEEMEHYYEATTESWERFAWLRARQVAGDESIGAAVMECLQPFVYRRTLDSDDLQRFLQIKRDMARQRQKPGNWNVKLGDGGIRDIEFFVQMLQIVNAYQHPVLKTTNTLSVLEGLVLEGFVPEEEAVSIRESYLFLRRLENRLQMIDERQTHQLADNEKQRVQIACSLGFGPVDEHKTLTRFDNTLEQHRDVARACFEKILPASEPA